MLTSKQSVEYAGKIYEIRWFLSRAQKEMLRKGAKGEESEYFFAKVAEYHERIKSMPVTYGQDGKGDQAIVYLHYFASGHDIFVTERDVGETSDGVGIGEQLQAYGWTFLGDYENAELGYIDLTEAVDVGFELDLHWTPKTLAEAKSELRKVRGF